MSKMILDNGKDIADYGKPYIIAEIGANHNGDMQLARKMIDEAKRVGCDCVKFQSWSSSSIFSKKVYEDNYFLSDDYRNRTDYTLKSIVEKFSVSEKELFELYEYCNAAGVDFSSSPFSKKEVDFLVDNCNVPFIKVASMDLNNYPFLQYIAKKQKPILLATGLSEFSEIDKAVRTIEEEGNTRICLLHCVSVYPPKFSTINLNNIVGLRSLYPNYPIGFSDHTLGIEIPIASIALGACVIEKHFTLDKDMSGWDHKVSANPCEMEQIVKYSNNINIALGSTRRIVGIDEIKKRDSFRRSIVSSTNIKVGELLTNENLEIKRPGTGLPPEMLSFVIGKRAKRDINYDTIICGDDFQ